MEFERDHALQQHVDQSRWRIFTHVLLMCMFLLTASSCMCNDQPLKDENNKLKEENKNLSKTKTEQDQKITTLTTANTNLEKKWKDLIQDQLAALQQDIKEAEDEKTSYGPPQGPIKDFIQKQIAERDKQLKRWKAAEKKLKELKDAQAEINKEGDAQRPAPPN